ncbi:MAG: DNA polymerase III subunit chi [Pseudomonadota bacterium]
MAELAFYHLQALPLERALPQLLGKCLERSWRALVEVGRPEVLGNLDEQLWTFDQSSFLPHASPVSVPSKEAGRHPIWLRLFDPSDDETNPNVAQVHFFVAGAMPPQNASFDAFSRTCLIFDGAADDDVSAARTVWKTHRASGHDLSYWQQTENGGWKKAASS